MKYKIPEELLQKEKFSIDAPKDLSATKAIPAPHTTYTLRMKEIHDFPQYLLLYKLFVCLILHLINCTCWYMKNSSLYGA